jgi:hypothetical protein
MEWGQRCLVVLVATMVLLFSAAAMAGAESADYLFGVGYRNAQPCEPYIYRIDLNGGIVWERSLPFTEFELNWSDGGRNLTEDALYLPIRGESNRVDGKVRIQKYDAAGDLAWDLPLSVDLASVSPNPVCGGCYAADYNLGVFRIGGGGNILWGPTCFGLSPGPGITQWSVAADPTTGGGFATHTLYYDNSEVIRFDRNGQVVWMKQLYFPLLALPNPVDGGIYQTADGYGNHVYRIDPEGEIEWDKSCFPSCYTYAHAVSPIDGSICIAGAWPHDITRATMDGTVLWTENHYGLFAPLSVAFDLREDALYIGAAGEAPGFHKRNASDFSQIWYVNPGHDLTHAMLYMGLPSTLEHSPEITGVVDVPNDQGGKVHVMWIHSDLDQAWSHGIASYTLWRRIKAGESRAVLGVGAQPPVSGFSDLGTLGEGTIRRSSDGMKWHYWEYVTSIPALGVDHYSYMAPTTSDSMAGSISYNVFQVDAREVTGLLFHMSLPDSGYSVDNLSPIPPSDFAGTFLGGTRLELTWRPNSEDDLSHYALYKGFSEDFVPEESNRLGVTSDALLVDDGYVPGSQPYYKLSAWDVHGNEGAFSLLRPEDVAGAGVLVPSFNALGPNAPNPLRFVTRIPFSLAEESQIHLAVYDVTGRTVRVLVHGTLGSSTYEAVWDGRDDAGRPVGAGVYGCRLETPSWSGKILMTVLR